MKKKILKFYIMPCIVLLAGLLFIIYVYRPIGIGSSIQEAVQKSGRTVLKTLYEDKVSGGEVIFYIKNSLDYEKANIAAGYVKKTLWGWKWIYGGEHGSIKAMCGNNGFSAQYFPAVEGTPFPLYFGVITNKEIDKIKIIELQRNIISEARISGSGDLRVWYMYIGQLKGSKFCIKAYSKEGKELSFINDDMSPYSADQKPMKQISASEYLKQMFGGEQNITEQDYNKLFQLNLYSDKQTYKTNEKIKIWATFEYVGNSKNIKIWHSDPYISFTISDGKDFNIGGVFHDILASTVLEKGKLCKFDYVKSGGYSADDPKADYWKKYFEEKDLYLPKGEYSIKVSGAFSLTEDTERSKSNLIKELKIKVEE